MSIALMDDRAEWDRFVEESPYGLLFHKWGFLRIMEKYSGYRLFPYGVYKGDELICLLPLFYRVKSGLRLVYSPPQQALVYVPYLGLVMGAGFDSLRQHKKEQYMDIVSRDVCHEIGRMGANHVSIASSPRLIDLRHFRWAGYRIEVGYTYLIDLRRSEQELWNSFSKDCKKSIRDCEKRPLAIKRSDDLDTFLRIMREDLAQKGSTFFHSQRPEYIAGLLAEYPDNLAMSLLYEGEAPVAAAINCEYKKHLLLWMCGKDCARGDYGEYLNWEFIKAAKARGCTFVENWGTEQKMLCVYKSKFNPSLQPSYVLARDDAIGRLAGWTYSNIFGNPRLHSLLKAG